jgi:excisionase family DNA binding protein
MTDRDASTGGPDPDELLTTAEVARILRVTGETVRRLGRAGRLPGFALSDRSGWRFRRRDVDAFIRAATDRRH